MQFISKIPLLVYKTANKTLFIQFYPFSENDFFDSLDKSELEQKNIQVGIFGYVRKKEKISKEYRKRKNYTCEKCSIKPKNKNDLHKKWWHTHHIDGNKVNNNLANLKCLCILCHSNVDARHKENFSKRAMEIEIQSFIQKYREELRNLNNPYF